MKYTIAIWVAALSSICVGQGGLGLEELPDCAVCCLLILRDNTRVAADRAPETLRREAPTQLRYQN